MIYAEARFSATTMSMLRVENQLNTHFLEPQILWTRCHRRHLELENSGLWPSAPLAVQTR